MKDLLQPSNCQLVPMSKDDHRLGHLIDRKGKIDNSTKIALIGFPCDQGVARRGGRVGAALGPNAIREQLFRLCPDPLDMDRFSSLLRRTSDLGDIKICGDLERDQESLGEVIAECLRRDIVPIVLGGGHETAYGHFLGYVKSGIPIKIVNFDAHLDVRETDAGLGHSGSPFRQMIEHPAKLCLGYHVIGSSRSVCAAVHIKFMTDRGCEIVWKEDLNETVPSKVISGEQQIYFSFDLDALSQSTAPGVSSPNADGVNLSLWLAICHLVGKSSLVRSLDFCECNPIYDRDGCTARVVARSIWEVLRGIQERS